ncbi:MAG: hypothetical protein GEU90_05400 [Gemmatimonas sp.]|nr:hypothetical protein [Gemmatimonas sp.]
MHALDYLRKPFTDERFYDALGRACRQLHERPGQATTTHDRVLAVVAELRRRERQERDRIVIQDRESRTYRVLRSREIDWIEAKDGGVLIHVGKQKYRARLTLTDVEVQLDPGSFMRIHRSRIVNRSRITEIKHLWNHEYVVTLTCGRSLGTGRTYRHAVEAFLAFG